MKYSDRKIYMYPSLKGALTYYIVTGGGGGQGVGGLKKFLCMVLGDGEGVGLVMTDTNEFFYKSQVFH